MTSELPVGFFVFPAPGDSSLRSLRKKLSLVVLETLLVATKASGLGGFVEAVARSSERKALRTALQRVDVMAPLLAYRSGIIDLERALADAVPAFLALLGKSAESFIWDAPVRRVIDAERKRVVVFEPSARGLLLDPSGIEARLDDGSRIELDDDADANGARTEHPFHSFERHPGPALALVDSNPLASLEEHPDKSGNAVDLGGRSVEEWTRALSEAFDLIALALPDLHAEMLTTLERVVPVGYEPEKRLSASYREAPGLVYLTLHPSPLTLAEALIHETQHGKLNVLSWFDPLLKNAGSAWTMSPVRPDLRPLGGVLLAAHAFVPVAALHQQLLELDAPISRSEVFRQRRAEVLASNQSALDTLHELAEPTDLGGKVLGALDDLHRVTANAP